MTRIWIVLIREIRVIRGKIFSGLSRLGRFKMKYRVHRFDIRMTADQSKLELFLNSLEGEVVAIIPNVTPVPATFVNFLLIVEKLG
jgi:hypothetical protein